MDSERQSPTPATPTDAPKKARRRILRPLLLALVLLGLAASIVGNLILYRRAASDYRSLSEVQLDPYGLKHPNFPPDTTPAVAEAADQLPVVVFFGDSRARQWPAPRMPGWRFVNRGIGGQTTEQLRGRFDAHVASLSPRVVVVQGGVNDLKAIPLLPGRRDEIVADCKANLRDLVRRARGGGASVIVTTVFPTGPVPLERRPVWSPEIERAVEEVNADLRGLAVDGIFVLDAWKLLSDGGRLRGEYAADTLHLTARGYEVLNGELEKVLRSMPDDRR
jgi:lysophospholipase L1-like esterase